MKLWQRTISLIALLGLGHIGCAQEENQPGTIIVDWDIVIGCSVANVETVEAKLIDLSSNLAIMSYDSASAACSAEEPIIFASVPPGAYELYVEGFDVTGEGTYLSEPTQVDLGAGATLELPSLPLTQKRGAIDISWVFSNGELCSANQVQSVQVSVLDETSTQLYEEELFLPYPCDPYELDPADRTIGANPEPTRELAGILVGDLIAGTHYVYIYGLNDMGEKVAKGMLESEVELAEVFDGKVTFVPCEAEDYPTMSCE